MYLLHSFSSNDCDCDQVMCTFSCNCGHCYAFSSSVSRITVPDSYVNKTKKQKNFCDTVGEYNVKILLKYEYFGNT